MTTPQIPVPFSWSVIGIETGQYEPGPNLTPVRGRRVTYRLGDGTTDTVFVADSQWGTDQANQIIERAAKATYDIMQLTGGSSSNA